MGILISSIVQFFKVGLEGTIEEEPKVEYQPITQVYAFPKGSLSTPSYCDSPEGQAMIKSHIDERNERKRIRRKHWFENLCGTPYEEIYARYGRDQFGNKIN